MRELEVQLLAEHEMLLPPSTYPLRGIAGNSQLSRRRKILHSTRGKPLRRQMLPRVRRVLTLGLW